MQHGYIQGIHTVVVPEAAGFPLHRLKDWKQWR